MAGSFAAVSQRLRVLRTVVGHPELRRPLIGYTTFSLAEHASWLTILLFAYREGGVAEVGVVGVLLLIPAGALAPTLARFMDRLPSHRALPLGYTGTAVALLATGAAMAADAPAGVVYGLAMLFALGLGFARPVLATVLPRTADDLDQLTAANVAVGAVENIGRLAGPAIAGLLLTGLDPGVVLLAFGGLSVAGALGSRTPASSVNSAVDGPGHLAVKDELQSGLRVLAGSSSAVALIAALTMTSMIAGALDVAYAAIAAELLDAKDSDASILATAFGAGSLLGASASVVLVGRRRLSLAVLGSSALAAAALAATGRSDALILTFALLTAVGVGSTLIAVSGRTMLQGLTREDTLAQLFGVLEALTAVGLAAGGLLLARLAVWVGLDNALAIVGALVVATSMASWPALARVDRSRRDVSPELMRFIRASTLFSSLPPYAIEQISHNTTEITHQPGDLIIRKGDVGDWMFLVSAGSAIVTTAKGESITCDVGSHLGEIALLKGQPRSADVHAGEDGLQGYRLEQSVFLEAVNAVPRNRSQAEALADRRLTE